MKCFIVLSALLLFLTIAKAENRQEIMNLLAQKILLQDPDALIYSQEARNELDAFMRKHGSLFDSLGKEEIFYHIQLTTDLYSDRRPGFQPHAKYALYLYEKFHEDYTEEENELISKNVSVFFEKGWISPQDHESFQTARLKKDSTGSMSSVGGTPGSGEKSLKTPSQSDSGSEPPKATPSKISVEQKLKSTETKSLSFSLQGTIVAGVVVVGFGLLWVLLKKRK